MMAFRDERGHGIPTSPPPYPRPGVKARPNLIYDGVATYSSLADIPPAVQ